MNQPFGLFLGSRLWGEEEEEEEDTKVETEGNSLWLRLA